MKGLTPGWGGDGGSHGQLWQKRKRSESHWGLNRVVLLYNANSCGEPWFIVFLIKKSITSSWWTQVDEWQVGKVASPLRPRPLSSYLSQVLSSLCPEQWRGTKPILPPSHHPCFISALPSVCYTNPIASFALNRSLLLFVVITFHSLWQLWGFLMERIISMSALSKNNQHKTNPAKTENTQRR